MTHPVRTPNPEPLVPTDPAVDLPVQPALTEAITQALTGDWAAAERTVHACLSTLPTAALPQAYIACVALLPRLVSACPAGEWLDSALPGASGTGWPASPDIPRLFAVRDPALDYAHAVLTALRGRLATLAAPVRQAEVYPCVRSSAGWGQGVRCSTISRSGYHRSRTRPIR